MSTKVDQKAAREMNRMLILNALRERGPLSRADLSAVIGLSAATVTIATSDLIDEGIVVAGNPSKGDGDQAAMGRRPIPLDLNYSGLVAVGHKIMLGKVDSVLTNLATTPILARSAELPDQSPDTVVAVCAKMTDVLLREVGEPNAQLIGIGLAMPGRIESGVCIESKRFGWSNVPVGRMLADLVNVPVWAEDDTNAFALAQQLFRLGRGYRTMGALAIGTGISCAVVVDGAVHHGAHSTAGNLGHCVYDPTGPLCECGKRGCLQALFSEPALLRRWRAETSAPETAGAPEMAEAARGGDKLAISLLKEAGEGIGRYLAIFANIVDPEIIVAGGEAVVFGDFLFGPMQDALAAGCLSPAPGIKPDWTDNSWAQGAAALATRPLFHLRADKGSVKS